MTVKDAALELEVLEAVALVGGLAQLHDGLGRQGLLAAQAAPRVGVVVVVDVGQVGLLAIADIEEVAKEAHGLADLTVPEQRRDGHAHVLAQDVEQRRLDGSLDVHGGAQVEGLVTTAARVERGVLVVDGLHDVLIVADGLANDERLDLVQDLDDLVVAGNLAHALDTLGVREDHDAARKERRVGAGEVEKHAVVTSDRIDFHLLNGRHCHGGSFHSGHKPACLLPVDVQRQRGIPCADYVWSQIATDP